MIPEKQIDALLAADPQGTRDMMLKMIFIKVLEIDATVTAMIPVLGAIGGKTVGADLLTKILSEGKNA